ncbi:hypothetical protein [Microvirga massiliensis]|uniref:hypothetical protein n=1 Tax=Microvirga massiliensis TaxID=1033741 RepID=UPI0011CC3282|nr:hypothetical protein [Microvirga massiliensis]
MEKIRAAHVAAKIVALLANVEERNFSRGHCPSGELEILGREVQENRCDTLGRSLTDRSLDAALWRQRPAFKPECDIRRHAEGTDIGDAEFRTHKGPVPL